MPTDRELRRREAADLARAVSESYNSEEAKLLRAEDAEVRASERKLKKQKIDHDKVKEANGPSLTEEDAILMAIAASLDEEAAPAAAAAAAAAEAAAAGAAAAATAAERDQQQAESKSSRARGAGREQQQQQ